MARNKLAPPTVVSVSRGGLLICGTNITELLKMPFPPNVLKDLNVVDLPMLTAQVKTFVEENHIKSAQLVIILDEEVYFEKQLGDAMSMEVSQQVQDFVDSVPLSNPSSKVFKVDGKYHVVVINRHLYESVRAAFEAVGFGVVAVVPELVLGQVGVGATFDANACRLVLRKMDFIKENSYVGPAHDPREDNLVNKNKGMAVGLSVGSMLMALGVIGFFSWQVTQTKQAAIARLKARAAETSQKVTATPTLLPTPMVSVADLTVEVLGKLDEGATLGGQLRQKGFTSINLQVATSAAQSSVVFTPRVSPDLRGVVTNIVKQIRPAVLIQENPGSLFDVLITLGQITP